MLSLMAAVLAASASTPPLESSVPWFERISVTIDDKGMQQSCTYRSSLSPAGAEECDPDMAASLPTVKGNGGSGLFSKLTFERRFSPGGKLVPGKLQAGDKLYGQQVMHLRFGADGGIAGCKIVGTSGDILPRYGCDQAKAEQFKVEASFPAAMPREAFMTIMVYGHQEQIA